MKQATGFHTAALWALALVSILTATDMAALAESPYPMEWIRQFGTEQPERGFGLAVSPAGQVYASGITYGNLFGQHLGSSDSYLVNYTPEGELTWARQFGTPRSEWFVSGSTDQAGNAYVSGQTSGNMGAGRGIYVVKYAPGGDLAWSRQFYAGSGECRSATDQAGNVFFAGGSNSGLIGKLDADGNTVWTRSRTLSYRPGVAVDGIGNLYISGGSISKWDTDGNLVWEHPGSGQALAVDSSRSACSTSMNVISGGRNFPGSLG